MPKLFPALLAILFLVGCAPTSIEPSKKTTTENDNFERNLECQKLKDDLEKEWESENQYIESLFYSSKTKSCLFVVDSMNIIGDKIVSSMILRDAFTKKEISWAEGNLNENLEEFIEFDQIVAEHQN